MPALQDVDPASVPPAPEWTYCCNRCRQGLPATDADVLRHLREGFPRCCGELMALEHLGGSPRRPDDGGNG